MESYRAMLWRMLNDCDGLAEHDVNVAGLRARLEAGRVTEAEASYAIPRVQRRIQEWRRRPNYLPAPPDDTLMLNGNVQPDFTNCCLVERPEIRAGLKFTDRVRHVVIVGPNGTGKTNYVNTIINGVVSLRNGISPYRISLGAFDYKNGELAFLKKILGEDCLYLGMHNGGMHLGFQPPVPMPLDVWNPIVCSLFADRAGMVDGAGPMMALNLRLAAALNSDPRKPFRSASLRLMRDCALRLPPEAIGAKPQYVQTFISKADQTLMATRVFDNFGGLDLERDLRLSDPQRRLSMVIDMPATAPAWVRQFAVDLLLAQVLHSRSYRHVVAHGTEFLGIVDEADQDFTDQADRQIDNGMPIIAQTMRMGRGMGIGLVVGAGQLQRLSSYVQSEALYMVVFAQGDANSLRHAANCLALSPKAAPMLAGLPTGQAIFRQAQHAAFPDPVLIQVDHVPPLPGASNIPYDSHSWVPEQPIDELPEVLAMIRQIKSEYQVRKLHQNVKSPDEKLSDVADQLLKLGQLDHWLPCVHLWRKHGKVISPVTQMAAREELETKKMARFTTLQIGSRKLLVMVILEAGYQHLNIQAPPHKEGGGTEEHTFPIHWLAMWCEQRKYKDIFIDNVLANTPHRPDVQAKTPAGLELWEYVNTCQSNLVSHLQHSFSQPGVVARVHIVAPQKTVLAEIEQLVRSQFLLNSDVLQNVSSKVLDTYLKDLWP